MVYTGSRVSPRSTDRGRPIVNPNPDGRPYAIWAALTAASYRYDVKSFTVVLRYQLLR